MKTIQTKGLVIYKFLIGEGDNFITFYTQDYGKLKVKVRGAKKVTGRFMGHLEYLNLCNLEIYKGPRNLTLTNCNSIESFPKIKKDFDKLNQSLELIKLINKISYENEKNEELFRLIFETLNQLNQNESTFFITEAFKLKLLNLLGFLPNFKKCTYCENKTSEKKETYLSTKGSLICNNCKTQTETITQIDFKNIKLCHFLNKTPISNINKIKSTKKERYNFQILIDNILSIHFP